jgi:hypothetical protein
LCSRFRLKKFERLLRLTEAFTWEDQPPRDPHTGHTTLAGWIPRVQKLLTNVFGFSISFHIVTSAVRVFVFHEILYKAWYPFDTASSPGYEVAVVMQVTACPMRMISFGPVSLWKHEHLGTRKNYLLLINLVSEYIRISEVWTASVVSWSEFLATDPEARVRFPALPENM